MPAKQAWLKKMKVEHGNKHVDKVTIDQLIGGARSIKSMLWEPSLLDPLEGIRFRGCAPPLRAEPRLACARKPASAARI